MEWTIVAGVVAVFALFLFFKPITRLIDRISGASKQGITFERPQDGAEIAPATFLRTYKATVILRGGEIRVVFGFFYNFVRRTITGPG